MRRWSISTQRKLRAIREMPSRSAMRPTTARLRAGGTAGEVSALCSSGEPRQDPVERLQFAHRLLRVHGGPGAGYHVHQRVGVSRCYRRCCHSSPSGSPGARTPSAAGADHVPDLGARGRRLQVADEAVHQGLLRGGCHARTDLALRPPPRPVPRHSASDPAAPACRRLRSPAPPVPAPWPSPRRPPRGSAPSRLPARPARRAARLRSRRPGWPCRASTSRARRSASARISSASTNCRRISRERAAKNGPAFFRAIQPRAPASSAKLAHFHHSSLPPVSSGPGSSVVFSDIVSRSRCWAKPAPSPSANSIAASAPARLMPLSGPGYCR